MLQTLFTQKYLLTARLQMLNLKKQSQKTAKVNLLYPWFYSDTDNGIQQFRQGKKFKNLYSIFFFYQGFLSLTIHMAAAEEKELPFSSLPLLPAHKHSDIYLQLHIRLLQHIYNHSLVVTRQEDDVRLVFRQYQHNIPKLTI